MTEWPHCSVVEAIGLGLFACEWTHLQATLWLVMFAQMFLAFSMGVAQFTIRWGRAGFKGAFGTLAVRAPTSQLDAGPWGA